MYEILFNERAGVLEARYSGFWDVETARAFAADMTRRLAELRARHGTISLLSDSREFPVQSAAVLEVLGAFTEQQLALSRSRSAILVKTALSSLQAKRLVASDALVRVFTDEGEARAWLAEGKGAASAA